MARTTSDTQREPPPIGPVGRRIVGLLHWARRAWWKLLLAGTLALVGLMFGMEYVTSRPGFCGSCHNMQAYHQSWQKDIHSQEGIICVECHYAPGEQHTLHAKLGGLSRLVSYASGAFGGGRLRGHVPSDSCMRVGCHPQGSFETKPYVFPKMAEDSPEASQDGGLHSLRPFTHEKHLGELPNGQNLQCATCHEHRAGEAHMATYREACYLCHFNQKLFNTDRARCLMCHTLPDKPIQRAGEEPITHQMLTDRKVACASCHADYVRGGGPVHKERCRACHDQPGLLAEWELVKPHAHATKAETEGCEVCQKALRSKVKMHQSHVPTQAANCFDCHIEIQHGPSGSGLEMVRAQCQTCHGEVHKSTVALLEGRSSFHQDGGKLTPHAMLSSHTVCTGCHTEKGLDCMQREVLTGTEKSCQSCHGAEHVVFASWKKAVSVAQREAGELQKAAHAALKEAESKGAVRPEQADRFRLALKQADEKLLFIKHAGAIHNQKLATRLLNDATDLYEDTVDDIQAAASRKNPE